MLLGEVVSRRAKNQSARLTVLRTLKVEIYPLTQDDQVRVVEELMTDLTACLAEYRKPHPQLQLAPPSKNK